MMQDREMQRLSAGFSDTETALRRNAASLHARLETDTACDKAALLAALQAINAALTLIENSRDE
jgi:hypothetical protein